MFKSKKLLQCSSALCNSIMTTPTIRRAPPIELVGDLEVVKPPLHRRKRKVCSARTSCPAFLTILCSQMTRNFKNLGRSKGLIFLRILPNAFQDFAPPVFHYGLEIGILYSDFMDKIDFWSKEMGRVPSVKQAYGCVNGSGWIINFGHTTLWLVNGVTLTDQTPVMWTAFKRI